MANRKGSNGSQEGLQWQHALDLLFAPEGADAVCFSSAIGACAGAGKWDTVLQLVEVMLARQIREFSIARYEHVSQAGSSLDCFKHSVLVLLLERMSAEPSPFTYIDSHAGPAVYDLESSPHASRGILRLTSQTAKLGGPLAKYTRLQSSQAYLGSPMLASRWLRKQDSAKLFELSNVACSQLKRNFPSDRISVCRENSYWTLVHEAKSEDRRLVLIDPPYDPYETYMAWTLYLLRDLYLKWPNSCMVLWYPYLDENQIHGLYQRLQSLKFDALVAEFGFQESKSLETSGRPGTACDAFPV